jgi:hypothetical protein
MQVISVEQDTLDIVLRVTFGSGGGVGFTAQGFSMVGSVGSAATLMMAGIGGAEPSG